MQIEGRKWVVEISCAGLTTRRHARLVGEWVASIGLDPHKFETHLIEAHEGRYNYRRTGKLRAIQLWLEHRRVERTVRDLFIEIDDTVGIAEKIEIWSK